MSFAGGFTLGVVQAGLHLVAKREMRAGFGMPNCEANRDLLGHSWRGQAADPDDWEVVPAEVVFGNPPCSGFSVMSAKHFRGADSPINSCMWAFAEYVSRVRPQIAVFESVQQARNSTDGLELMRALREYVVNKTGMNWTLHHVRHNAYSVGGCSMRKRYFWLITRIPFGIERQIPARLPRLHEVISDLDGLHPTWMPQPYVQPPTWWSKDFRSDTGGVDGHIGVSNPLARRIADIMAMTPWNPGEHTAQVVRRHYETHGELPPSWQGSAAKIIANDFSMGFTTPVRWNGQNPARVITGAALQTAIHPYLDRALTHREAARIMGFPDDWKLWPLRNQPGLSMTHGKGITVQCGKWIAGWIRAALDENPGTYRGTEIGPEEFDIDVTHDWQSSPGTVTL
jgi:site-specific DNA-cytosine methylase